MKTITFNELRKIKDALPVGSTSRIAAELGVSVETVKNYFGGVNETVAMGGAIHVEPGPDGGIVVMEDPSILDKALVILGELSHNVSNVSVNV